VGNRGRIVAERLSLFCEAKKSVKQQQSQTQKSMKPRFVGWPIIFPDRPAKPDPSSGCVVEGV
jgi:hypothetical protein